MKNLELGNMYQMNKKEHNIIVRFAAWISKKNLPFFVISIGMIVMLLWAGSYKMTIPGADGIVPLVTNSPLISWHFKLLGTYVGSDFIGLTEVIAAILIIIGFFKPQIGIIGGAIGIIMFFTTSTMLITTPDSLVDVNGVKYMSFLGLFLYKDIIGLGASLFLITQFGKKAMLKEIKAR
ncbi:putative membrane protein YkgB [Chryseobacterium ginsenosidimutans]|uniref:YkgB family protein n=1 Tax=Chryseobacterium ginsenosidimutans TaxID=687846 RepID=UPI002167C5B2|nr:YkgB family protein [Chryseobacterium ginsenosidimutans]MCS3869339.1 putative membrane protein YkgB [Chryseobacterium ginsenosidimutans]